MIEELEEQKGTFRYLLILKRKGSLEKGLYNTNFIDEGMHNQTAKRARDLLEKMELITTNWIKKDGRVRVYSFLTEKGLEIAQKVEEIELILRGKEEH